ncbi:MAG: GNAT family N-acetyltransferase [Halobacteriales archaeon]
MPGPVFLEGATVELRTVEEEDLPYLQARVNDQAIRRPIGRSTPVNADQERSFYENVVCADDSVDLLIARDGEAVGMISLNPIRQEVDSAELGYWLAPEHHGEGYTSEAAALLVRYGFEQLGLNRIYAHVFAFNDPSRRLLEGLGFVQEGTLREAAFVDGERVDAEVYGLLRREWADGGTDRR